MLLVSTFELLIARIAPPIPGPVGAFARRIVQGYFLNVSNLENRQIRVGLRLTMAVNPGNRSMTTANSLSIGDGTGTDNVNLGLTVADTGSIRRVTTSQTITLDPQHTGLLTVLPNTSLAAAADLEIRGYVELFQVPRFIFAGAPAARVLVTPETRGTFLDNDYPAVVPTPTNAELDFDQVNYGLPIASGKSENTIPAVPRINLGTGVTVPAVTLAQLRAGNPGVPDDVLQQVVDMMQAGQ